jgi:hypothetical protein
MIFISHKRTQRKQESVSHRGLKRRGKRTEGEDGLIATKEHRENKERMGRQGRMD